MEVETLTPQEPVSMQAANLEAGKQLYTARVKLDPDKKQIRLLHLEPGRDDESLSCTLSVASLADNPVYHALSYVWGDTNINRETLLVEGIRLEVGHNLATFLRHIRSDKESMTLWTDAICINQSDDKEKAHQVPLMQEIYTQTAVCFAWLGSASGDITLVPQILTEIDEGKHLFETCGFDSADDTKLITALAKFESHDDRDALKKFLRSQPANENEEKLKQYLRFNESSWARPGQHLIDACAPWYQNEYFRRLWTYQEICLPSRVELYWSSTPENFDFAELAEKSLILFRIHKACCLDPWAYTATIRSTDSSAYTAFIETMCILLGLKARRARKGHNATISSLAFDTIDRSTLHAHDYIYGIMGLVVPRLELIPDYGKPVGDIFAEAAQISMTQVGNVNLLSYASGIKPEAAAAATESNVKYEDPGWDSCLPSWVPDFGRMPALLRGLQQRIPTGGHAFQASAGQPALIEYNKDSLTTISLIGVHIGTVQHVLLSDNMRFIRSAAEPVLPTDMLIDELEVFIETYNQGNNDAVRADMLWRLLLRDLSVVSAATARATEEDGAAFLRFRGFLKSQVDIDHASSLHVPYELSTMLNSIAMGQVDGPKRFYATDKGSLGSVLAGQPQVGDEVWVFLGGNVPYLVRPHRVNEELVKILLVGETYVHGYMDGKAIHDANGLYKHCVLS